METPIYNPSTKVYGTTGLPHFGAKAIDGGKSANLAKVDGLFNDFVLGMKNIAATGNDIALIEFCNWVKTGYYLGQTVAAGKGIVNV
jgi:hypothetical protein